MYKPSVSAILQAAAEHEDVEDTVEHILKYDSLSLRTILKMIWCPSIKFHKDLGEGPTDYKPSKFDEPGRLPYELKRMYLFLDEKSAPLFENSPKAPELTPEKRKVLWIQLLESLSPDDALLLDTIKDKKTPWKRISRHMTKKAYPGLINE